MRALPYLVMLVGAVATFVRVRMSVRRASRPSDVERAAPRDAGEPDVAVEEREGVRSARARLRSRGRPSPRPPGGG